MESGESGRPAGGAMTNRRVIDREARLAEARAAIAQMPPAVRRELQEYFSNQRRVVPLPPRRPRPGHAWMTDEPHHYAPVPRSGPGVFGPLCLLAVALSGVALVLLIWGVTAND